MKRKTIQKQSRPRPALAVEIFFDILLQILAVLDSIFRVFNLDIDLDGDPDN